MQKFRTCFLIAAFLCLAQQSAFAGEEIDTSTSHPIEEGVSTSNSQPVEKVENSSSSTEGEFDPTLSQPEYSVTEGDDSSSTGKDMLSEIIIRPVAVIGSVTGLAIFVVASPFSGLASIPEPHDAFKTTWDDFVVTPYYFAFRRPLGDYSVELN